MPLSNERCQKLADKIEQFEDALDRLALGEQEISVQDGASVIRFQTTNRSKIEARLHELRTEYFNGACPVVLENDDILPTRTRRALRPVIGHN